jgi:hypothetical protein
MYISMERQKILKTTSRGEFFARWRARKCADSRSRFSSGKSEAIANPTPPTCSRHQAVTDGFRRGRPSSWASPRPPRSACRSRRLLVSDLADGRVAPFAARKIEALFALLASRPDEAPSRHVISGTLWSDGVDRQARHSLSQAMTALRHAFVEVPRSSGQPRHGGARRVVGGHGRRGIRAAVCGARPSRSSPRRGALPGALLHGFGLREERFEE